MYVGIDPGIKNLAIWVGNCTDDGLPITHSLNLYNLKDTTKTKSTNLSILCTKLLDTLDWIQDRNKTNIKLIFLETQAPRNIPARIVASTIYGYLSAKGFSISWTTKNTKAKAMQFVLDKYKIVLPSSITASSNNNTNKKPNKWKENKQISKTIARYIIPIDILKNHKKIDDITDAVLIGMGGFSSSSSL
jgi:hypothetical protein